MYNIEIKDQEAVVVLEGRIDSTNASSAEAQILEGLKDTGIQTVVLDAGQLEYISSAGLRILLHIKKLYPQMCIRNVSTQIYEILEMTGFTQMMEVEKSYREVSVEGAEVIGEGANGRLYRIDSDSVVKVYNNPDALEDIKMEREKARTALVLGIPTAISYDVVKVGDKYGSVFELLNARCFAGILEKEPERFDWCVREYTDMLTRIHDTLVPEGKLPQFKDTARSRIHFLKEYLPESAYDKACRLIEEVPEDPHMIHGDYHIKNLELQGDEVLLIDMDTLAVGHPVFELASMYNAYLGFSEADHDQVKRFLGIDWEMSGRFWQEVLKQYLGTEDLDAIRQVEDKARIIGYIRLIRRSIRRNGLESEAGRAKIDLWKEELMALLERTDTLLFER